jgi:hypothetical protein
MADPHPAALVTTWSTPSSLNALIVARARRSATSSRPE